MFTKRTIVIKGGYIQQPRESTNRGLKAVALIKLTSSILGIAATLMVNGPHLYSAFIQSALVLTDIHPFMHTFTCRRRSQPHRATASSSGALRVGASRSVEFGHTQFHT